MVAILESNVAPALGPGAAGRAGQARVRVMVHMADGHCQGVGGVVR